MDKDFLTGLSISVACAALPVRKIYPTVDDVLDNEWPIEWSLRSTAKNKTYIQGNMNMRKISDAVDYDYAKAAVTVTAMPDSGGEVVFTTKNIGVTEWELGVLIYIQCTYNGTTYVLGLSVVEKAGTFGSVEFEKGTYYAFMDNNYQSITFSDADVRFEMAKPEPEKVKIFALLPRWNTKLLDYNLIALTPGDNRIVFYSATKNDITMAVYNGQWWDSNTDYSPIKIPTGAVYAKIVVPSDMQHYVRVGEVHDKYTQHVASIYSSGWKTDGFEDVSAYADGNHYLAGILSYQDGRNIPEDFDTSVIDFYFTDADGNVINPTAYSYNGVILPALPEWDREEYPYAFMHKAMSYQLWVGKEITYNGADIGIVGAYLHYYSSNAEWKELSGGTDIMVCDIAKVEWANFDVLDESGSVVLPKSDPIPVYE